MKDTKQKKYRIRTWIDRIRTLCTQYVDSRYAEPILYMLSFIESFIFPIPPDTLLIPMSFIKPQRSYRYAFWCTIASVLGGAVGYGIGVFFLDSVGEYIIRTYSLQEVYQLAKVWFEKYGVITMLVAGITPVPYKLATIMAGTFAFNFPIFLITSFVGRGVRFFIFATLPHIVQTRLGRKIQKNIGIVFLLVLLLLIGIVSVAYLIKENILWKQVFQI